MARALSVGARTPHFPVIGRSLGPIAISTSRSARGCAPRDDTSSRSRARAGCQSQRPSRWHALVAGGASTSRLHTRYEATELVAHVRETLSRPLVPAVAGDRMLSRPMRPSTATGPVEDLRWPAPSSHRGQSAARARHEATPLRGVGVGPRLGPRRDPTRRAPLQQRSMPAALRSMRRPPLGALTTAGESWWSRSGTLPRCTPGSRRTFRS